MMIHEQIKVLTFFFLSFHLLSKPVMGFTTGDSVTSTKTFGWLVILGLSALLDSISAISSRLPEGERDSNHDSSVG